MKAFQTAKKILAIDASTFPAVAIGGQGDKEIQICGIHHGLGWLGSEVQSRRASEQTSIVSMNGREALWDTSAMYFCDERTVEYAGYHAMAPHLLWKGLGACCSFELRIRAIAGTHFVTNAQARS
ncbi:hypothetical protein CA85_12330 [Allorhodopirellula solitaria]|uniref:Uncharacterized protein n=1 Tax=Allorhodopirellula solitaria TaxID=2527987 RepID=A0A5C5YHN1_9BACT|nr:hypothetical protein CA85_12330 [Allorhodopirellula solitaria]